MMKRELIITQDGSHTIRIPALNVTYHSTYGAIQESKHIYINAGFNAVPGNNIEILEIGFGTGLNALLTFTKAHTKNINYTSIEPYPLPLSETSMLNYCEILSSPGLKLCFDLLHSCKWEQPVTINNFFSLYKTKQTLQQFHSPNKFDLVYFDVFAPDIQPELWSLEIFQKIFICMKNNSRLVTYSCKGDVRRAMQAAGFMVKKMPGPPGKREFLRAEKV